MRKLLRFVVTLAVVAAVLRWLFGQDRAGRRWWRTLPGRLRGLQYALTGRHPDDDVDDHTLADRVRSTLGPLEHELDLPHVHVMAENGVILLHGEVSGGEDAAAIERAARRVWGVRGVESYLHVGLLASDTRPSQGRAVPPPPSAAKQRLLDAARDAGAAGHATKAVRAVLSVFAERVPEDEREQLLLHLPADVRAMAASPRRLGRVITRQRKVAEMAADVATEGELPLGTANKVAVAVLTELRGLVPEEAEDVAATLPEDLRDLWPAAAG